MGQNKIKQDLSSEASIKFKDFIQPKFTKGIEDSEMTQWKSASTKQSPLQLKNFKPDRDESPSINPKPQKKKQAIFTGISFGSPTQMFD